MRNRIARIEITKAVTIPTSNIAISVPVKAKPNFTSFNRLAPNITGIPKKKLNSAAKGRESPRSIAPKIVAPEREVPGIRANTWNAPIKKAMEKLSWLKVFTRGFFPLLRFSRIIKRTPYTINVTATVFLL